MRTVRISADLERRLRESSEPLVLEIVGLLDNPKVKPPTGMAYADIVREFRQHLGASLALPPNPSAGWIVRQVTRAKELGLDVEQISRVSAGVRKAYPRGPYELEFLLRAAPRLIHAADAGGTGGSHDNPNSRVHTGRPDDGD